eukprot:553911_1
MQEWEALRREARQLEGRLEEKVQAYAKISERMTISQDSMTLYDAESPPIAYHMEEAELASDVENLLTQLEDTVHRMQTCVSQGGEMASVALIQRYQEIHFDYNSEYRKAAAVIQKANAQCQRAELFRHANPQHYSDNADTDVLLRERGALRGSMAGAANTLGQAYDAKRSLKQQKTMLLSSNSTLQTMLSRIPQINGVVEAIRKRKKLDRLVIAVVFALCLCFFLWWIIS